VSILVCTLNSAGYVETKIRDILAQNYPLNYIQMIIVDGGSNDGTVQILRQVRERLHSKLDLRVIEGKALKGKASQINEGFRVAEGDIVITTDADVRIDRDGVGALVDLLSVDNVGAACARQVLTNSNQSFAAETEATYRGFYETLRIGESNAHSTLIYHGGLSAYHRGAISPIAEDVNADDTQLALSVIRKGFRAIYDPQTVFYAESPCGIHDAMRQRIRRAQGLQRVFWRNRDMLFQRKFGKFGFPIFFAEFIFHLIMPFVFGVVAVCLATILMMSLLQFLPIALPMALALVMISYWGRRWFPTKFLVSFTLYMTALICAMILHSVGYNYRRWSSKNP